MKLFDHICLTPTWVLSVYQLSGLTLARSSANLHMENLCWQFDTIIDKKDKSPTLSSPPIIKWYKTSRSHTRNVNLISDHLILLLIAVQGYIWLPLTPPSRRFRSSALNWKKHKYTSLSCQNLEAELHLSYHSQLESALRLEINTPTCPPLHVCETRYGLHDKQHGCHMQFSIACFNLTDHLQLCSVSRGYRQLLSTIHSCAKFLFS